jgi:ABC transport system ATP-binding/permease protein
MVLLRINNVSISFGGPLLLDSAALQIEPGERIGLLGRNGSGKSTLMKMISGDIAPDQGNIIRNGDIRTAMLPQDVSDDLPGTVYDVVASGVSDHIELLREYHDLTLRLSHQGDDSGLIRSIEQVQHQLESSGAWDYHQKVETVIMKTDLDENAEFKYLSAGLKRRVFLARALVNEPDILLLDEPTNHLDISSILWLEDFLLRYNKTIMFVSHDRAFLRKLASRIVEIDRGRLLSFSCDYGTYIERRQAMLEEEEKHRLDFDKKLAKEEVWVRRGLEARRTRNEGRVRALMHMRQERALRREQEGRARLVIQEAEKSGRLVADAKNISFAYGDNNLIKAFSTTIMRGDKVGIMGPNGSGKTTLLKLLLDEIKPLVGHVRLGTKIKIAYFDQLRAQLDENKTLKENIAGSSDQVFVGGVPRHIVGYLQDFLFTAEQIMSQVRTLSGGERNRLLLAKLFSAPSNVLVLDEPTNDLDAETLEMLEDRLVDFNGTVLMVSHDRDFLNNVVTSTIVFEGGGCLQEYVGGYDDWLIQRPMKTPQIEVASKVEKQKKERSIQEKKKLSFKESRELEGLPLRIEGLEEEKNLLFETLNDPVYQVGTDARAIHATNDKLEALEKELEEAYRRWDELEELAVKYNT